MALNDDVKAWVDNKVGQAKVGKGECFDLADMALKEKGAKSAEDFGSVADGADYIWGTAVADLKLAIAGDILQFRDYDMTTTVDVQVTEKGPKGEDVGSSFSNNSTSISRPHHTAVLMANNGAGSFTVAEQNVAAAGSTTTSSVVLKNNLLVSGSTKKETTVTTRTDPDWGVVTVTTVTTTTVTVKGTIKAYRPVKK